MAILIIEGADPLSDAALKSESESIVRNAQSDAGRVLKLELLRYCRGEVHGRSFLVAGHRGAGKTMMVADALDKVLRRSRRPDEQLLRPLPIFLHGPSLFETEAPEPPKPDDGARRPRPRAGAGVTPDPQAQARVALKQILLGIHRAVVREFSRAYRDRLMGAPGMLQPSPLPRDDLAGLAAQFEIELTEDPPAARLHEFWEMAGARHVGVLFEFPQQPGQGARELVALNGMCNAHQRISGEISARDKTARSEDVASESQSGLDLRGGELAKPLAAVLAGAAVAGGAAAGAHGLGMSLAAGLVTAIGSAAFFKATTTTTRHAGRQLDTTFIPDLSLRTLDRILPTLIQRLRDCGLAPLLVVDELDKVPDLAERFIPMMDFMKKLVAENIFSCFITDRGYLETLRMRGHDVAHGRASSYFTHSLLVAYRPADVAAYLDVLLQVDRGAAPALPVPESGYQAAVPDVEADVVDLEVLKWVLRHRSRLHALGLAREIAALRAEGGTLHIAPGAVRTEYTYLIDVTFQVAIEFQLAQPHVQAWLRQRPGMAQTLLDALYFPTREWLKGDASLAPAQIRDRFCDALVARMNLAEASAAAAVGALSEDDKSFLATMMEDVLRFLRGVSDVTAASTLWGRLPPRAWSPRADPGLPVLQCLLLGDRSLVTAEDTPTGTVYAWRYFPTGEERRPRLEPAVPGIAGVGALPAGAAAFAAPAAEPGAIVLDELVAAMSAIERIEANLFLLFRRPDDPPEPDGRMFQLLGDRLRVLPTTPAWTRVRAAMANIRQVAGGGGSRSTLIEDGRALTDFQRMLQGSARALIRALVVAAFCGAARAGTSAEDALFVGLEALSTGQGFAALDADGVAWAMERMETSAADSGAAMLATIGERAAARDLQDAALAADVAEAASLGRASLAGRDVAALEAQAWSALGERVHRFVATEDPPPATLHEVLCAVSFCGPSLLFGLDLRGMTLRRWTTAFLCLAGLPVPDVVLDAPPPRWLLGPVLNRLGAASLDPRSLESLVAWALRGSPSAAESAAAIEIANLRKPGNEPVEQGRRVALCVTAGIDAPMAAWTARPRRGLVLVVQAEMLGPVMAGPVEALQLPLLIATAQGPGVRIAAEQITRNTRAADRQVWVYRQRYAQMLEPAIVGPQGPDDVLDYVQPGNSSSAG